MPRFFIPGAKDADWSAPVGPGAASPTLDKGTCQFLGVTGQNSTVRKASRYLFRWKQMGLNFKKNDFPWAEG